jgi:uncharacterized coiled-coil DUF342 family protein
MGQDNNKKETKKELFARLDKLRKEIISSRNSMNKDNDGKESWFSKKAELSGNIHKKISSIKENKDKRDSLTKKVRELKEKRSNFNDELKKKISELAKLRTEVRHLTKTSKIKNPSRIQGDIDHLEVKLETEAMSFEKEKGLTKKLRLLKKSLEGSSEVINLFEKIKKSNSETNSARKKTHEIHKEIQKLASESQELHESIIKNSKEIDGAKIKEGEALKNFVNSKKKINNVNNTLKEKLSEINDVRNKINKFKLEEDEKRKLNENRIIKTKEQEMEEKIKTGKKLTTEDFLAFQEIIKNKTA